MLKQILLAVVVVSCCATMCYAQGRGGPGGNRPGGPGDGPNHGIGYAPGHGPNSRGPGYLPHAPTPGRHYTVPPGHNYYPPSRIIITPPSPPRYYYSQPYFYYNPFTGQGYYTFPQPYPYYTPSRPPTFGLHLNLGF